MQRFSRNPEAVEALKKDPLRRPEGTAKGLKEMITQVGEEMHRYVAVPNVFSVRDTAAKRLEGLAPRFTGA